MDPFCKIYLREDSYITNILKKAGKHPKWNQTFNIEVKYIGDDLKIECWDYEKIGSNELIGETKIKVSAFCVVGGMDDWFEI